MMILMEITVGLYMNYMDYVVHDQSVDTIGQFVKLVQIGIVIMTRIIQLKVNALMKDVLQQKSHSFVCYFIGE